MGYCLGGRLAFMMAEQSDADVNISYYGVGLDGLLDDLDKVTKPLVVHIADKDEFFPRRGPRQRRGRHRRHPLVDVLRLSERRPCLRPGWRDPLGRRVQRRSRTAARASRRWPEGLRLIALQATAFCCSGVCNLPREPRDGWIDGRPAPPARGWRKSAGALAGIKVIDLTRVLGGPYCTMILSDHGADVIKIEPPQGDEVRDWGPPFHEGDASYFIGVNRNKRAIALDLRQAGGQGDPAALLEDADVLIENFKPGAWRNGGSAMRRCCRSASPA